MIQRCVPISRFWVWMCGTSLGCQTLAKVLALRAGRCFFVCVFFFFPVLAVSRCFVVKGSSGLSRIGL